MCPRCRLAVSTVKAAAAAAAMAAAAAWRGGGFGGGGGGFGGGGGSFGGNGGGSYGGNGGGGYGGGGGGSGGTHGADGQHRWRWRRWRRRWSGGNNFGGGNNNRRRRTRRRWRARRWRWRWRYRAGVGGLNYLNSTAADKVAINTAVQDFFSAIGVNLTATGRSVAFNDKLGLLFVKAAPSELDTIERAIEVLNQVAPQVHIKARFIEVAQDDNAALGFDWYLGNFINGPWWAMAAARLRSPCRSRRPTRSAPSRATPRPA